MIFDLLTKHWQLSHGQQLWHTSEGVMGSTWAPVCPGGGTFRNEFPLNQPSGALEMVWHGNGRICIKPSLLSPDEHEQLEIKATNSQGCNGSWIHLECIHHPSRWRDPSHVSVNIFEKYWQKKIGFYGLKMQISAQHLKQYLFILLLVKGTCRSCHFNWKKNLTRYRWKENISQRRRGNKSP